MDGAIKKAVSRVGGQAELARIIGVTAQAVQQWVRFGRIPAERVLEVERATNGAVTRYELRPDLYPKEKAA